MSNLPAKTWLITAVVLGASPSSIGWLASYDWPVGFLQIVLVVGSILSLAMWFSIARFSLSIRGILIFVAAWLAIAVGGNFLGQGLTLMLWNPAWSPPFAAEGFAAQQVMIGIAVWVVTGVVLGRMDSIQDGRDS